MTFEPLIAAVVSVNVRLNSADPFQVPRMVQTPGNWAAVLAATPMESSKHHPPPPVSGLKLEAS